MQASDILGDKIKKSKAVETEADQVDLKGEDTGKDGLLVRFGFTPNPDATRGMSVDEVTKIAEKTLAKVLQDYCVKIGWFPNPNYEPYKIYRQDDGSFLIMSFLKKSITGKSAKDVSDVQGRIGINEK